MAKTVDQETITEVANDAKELANRIRAILSDDKHQPVAVKIALAEVVAAFCLISEKVGIGPADEAADDFHEHVKHIMPLMKWVTKQ